MTMGGGGVDTSAQREQLAMQREMLDLQKASVARDEARLAEQREREDAALRARRKGGGRSVLLNDEVGIAAPPAMSDAIALAA